MKNKILLTVGLALFAITAFFLSNIFPHKKQVSQQAPLSPVYKYYEQYKHPEEQEEREEENIKYAAAYLEKMKANQITGKIDLQEVKRARQELLNRRANNASKQGALGLVWEEQGPDNVGGRTRSILIDRQNPNRMFAGGVTGGLFISDNGGNSWSPHANNGIMGFQGISCMTQSSNGDIYIGTGESFVYTETNNTGHLGGGVYKSSDGGNSFTHLSSTTLQDSTQNDPWAYVNELAADPNNGQIIYAATSGGLMKTVNGGTTWDKVQGTLNGASREVAVGGDGTIYASISNRYYRSTDGINFEQRSGMSGFPNTNVSRMEFAVSPQDPNYVYVCLVNFNDGLNGIYQSTDAGINWNSYSPVNSSTFNPLGEQGNYDVTIAVDPADKERVWVGGQLELQAGGNNVGWNLIAFWQPRSVTNPYYIHADMHEITFHPTNPDIAFVGTDGGVFKTINAGSQFPTFTERNKGYNTTQFYNITVNSRGELLGGAQDNGTSYINLKGNTLESAIEVMGGDGGWTALSEINPLAMFAEVQFGELRRSSNGGESFSCFWDDVAGNDNCQPIGGSMFLAPFTLWENVDSNQSFMLFGGGSRVYITPDALNFSTTPNWYRVNMLSGTGNGNVSAFGQSKEGIIYVGMSNGNVYRLDGMPTATYTSNGQGSNIVSGIQVRRIQNASTWGTGRMVTGIGVNPNDADDVVVTLGSYGNSSYVYRCTTATTAISNCFTSIQGNLIRVPAYDAVIDYYSPDNIIVGTELGVWATNDGGQTWFEENNGMNPVPTHTMVQKKLYDSNCQVIYAGTYGRGMFRTTTLLEANGGNCETEPGRELVGIDAPRTIKTLSVYPNPIYDQAILELDVLNSTELKVQVVDLMGRVVKEDNFGQVSTGFKSFDLDFNDVIAGVYLVNIYTGKSVQTKRVFVTK